MAEQTPEAKRRIRRAVILTDGPAAEAVAGELQALSRAWLRAEPPLVVVGNVIQENAGGETPSPDDYKLLQPWQSLPPQADDESPQGDLAQVAAVSTAGYRPAFTLNDYKSLQPWQSLPPQADDESPQGDLAQVAAVSTAGYRPAFTLNDYKLLQPWQGLPPQADDESPQGDLAQVAAVSTAGYRPAFTLNDYKLLQPWQSLPPQADDESPQGDLAQVAAVSTAGYRPAFTLNDYKLLQPWQGLPPQADDESPQGDLAQVAAVSTAGYRPAFTLNALSQACDRLVSGEAIGRLRAAGYTLARPDEIQLWVMVDVTGDLELSPGLLPALLITLADAVWRRTRIHIAPCGLLLAEPEAEELAAQWGRALVDAGAEQVLIAGPVDAARLRWDPDAWQTRAATALATLLWSEVALPNPASLAGIVEFAEGGQDVRVWSVGAAAWQAPLAQIKEHVALRCALATAERLLGHVSEHEHASRERGGAQSKLVLSQGDAARSEAEGDAAPHNVRFATFDSGLPPGPTGAGGLPPSAQDVLLGSELLPPWELPELAVAPERHRLVLEGAVPPEPLAAVWGRQWPNWQSLAELPAALRATVEKRGAQAHDEQYTLRGEWLGSQVTAWETALARLQRERLTPTAGWPHVGLYHHELEVLAAQLQAACVTIEDWLEEAGQRFEDAAAEAERALHALEELCAGFPAPTRTAAWATLLQPWRWPAIVWAYWIILPRYVQKYLDAAYRQGQARWVEANTHALRQAYLAMAQVAHSHQAESQKMLAMLGEAQAALAGHLVELGAPPEPWDESELQRLAESLMPEAWPAAWAFHAPGTWEGPQGCCAAPGAHETLAPIILRWVENRLGEMAVWTAADCLANASDDAELAQRLGSLADMALPLWPGTDQEADAALWLIWPARASERGYHPAEERLQSSLQVWTGLHAGRRPHIHSAEGSASALLILRATAVTLDGRKQEVV